MEGFSHEPSAPCVSIRVDRAMIEQSKLLALFDTGIITLLREKL